MARSENNLVAVLQDTADAIKAKKNSTTAICPRDFADEIASISSSPALLQPAWPLINDGQGGYHALSVEYLDDNMEADLPLAGIGYYLVLKLSTSSEGISQYPISSTHAIIGEGTGTETGSSCFYFPDDDDNYAPYDMFDNFVEQHAIVLPIDTTDIPIKGFLVDKSTSTSDRFTDNVLVMVDIADGSAVPDEWWNNCPVKDIKGNVIGSVQITWEDYTSGGGDEPGSDS